MFTVLVSWFLLVPWIGVQVDAPASGGAAHAKRPSVTASNDGTRPAAKPQSGVVGNQQADTADVRAVKLVTEGASWPKVWIGVRLTEIPAPLAAHIGDAGVMVANVVKGGPADKAGIEQYDVLRTFNGQSIERTKDLTDAISQHSAGQPASLGIVRKGATIQINITPIERPADVETELKYCEPEEATLDALTKFRGHALQLDPSGNWTMRELGPLRGLPDVLKELQTLGEPGLWDEELEAMVPGDKSGAPLSVYKKLLRHRTEGTPDDADVQVEIKIQRDDSGQTLMIDGQKDQITVTRKDADGKETRGTYACPEDLKQADPEAYDLYMQHAPRGDPLVVRVRPFGDRADKLRQEFQVDVRKRLEEAVERADQAKTQALEHSQAALKRAREAVADVRTRIGDEGRSSTEMLIVQSEADGGLKVTVVRDGEEQKYEFSSEDDLKANQPELYEKVKPYLGE